MYKIKKGFENEIITLIINKQFVTVNLGKHLTQEQLKFYFENGLQNYIEFEALTEFEKVVNQEIKGTNDVLKGVKPKKINKK